MIDDNDVISDDLSMFDDDDDYYYIAIQHRDVMMTSEGDQTLPVAQRSSSGTRTGSKSANTKRTATDKRATR